MSTDTNEKKPVNTKSRSQIIIIVCIAALIIVTGLIFLSDANKKLSEEEQFNQQLSDTLAKKLDEQKKQADNVKSESSVVIADVVGTYKSVGYDNSVTIEIKDDNTVSVVSSDIKGWWVAQETNGITLIAMIFENTSEPEYFQVYGSRLLDTRSIYTGNVEIGKTFNSSLVMEKMTLTLTEDGKAEGRNMVALDDGSGLEYAEAFRGSYTVDGEFIDITLNGDYSRFLMFDYQTEGVPDGMASLYYEKIN